MLERLIIAGCFSVPLAILIVTLIYNVAILYGF